ncbi:MAG: hypothetical protein ACKVWR_14055 [Acidimicrobiales bacterium]
MSELTSASQPPGRSGAARRRLLVWDAPDIAARLSEVVVARLGPRPQPDLAAVRDWVDERRRGDELVEACVFALAPAGAEAELTPWVVELRDYGYFVFVKPLRTGADPVHARAELAEAMAHHLDTRFRQPGLAEVVVASHDADAFAAPLERLARAGVSVVTLGFREAAAFAAESPLVSFVDLEDVPGAFAAPLPRTNLFDLPSGGRWFDPFYDLAAPADPAGLIAAAAPAEASGALAPTARVAPRPEGPPPDRAEVLASLAVAVREAVAAGQAGLSVRDLGEVYRRRFDRHPLARAGFESVSELVAALTAGGELRLVRTPGRGYLLGLGRPASEPAAASAAGREPVIELDRLVEGANPIYEAFRYRPPEGSADQPSPESVSPAASSTP